MITAFLVKDIPKDITITSKYNQKNSGKFQCVLLPRQRYPRYLLDWKIVKVGETIERVDPCELVQCLQSEADIVAEVYGSKFYYKLPKDYRLMK
jgi:hypothetical protein